MTALSSKLCVKSEKNKNKMRGVYDKFGRFKAKMLEMMMFGTLYLITGAEWMVRLMRMMMFQIIQRNGQKANRFEDAQTIFTTL